MSQHVDRTTYLRSFDVVRQGPARWRTITTAEDGASSTYDFMNAAEVQAQLGHWLLGRPWKRPLRAPERA